MISHKIIKYILRLFAGPNRLFFCLAKFWWHWTLKSISGDCTPGTLILTHLPQETSSQKGILAYFLQSGTTYSSILKWWFTVSQLTVLIPTLTQIPLRTWKIDQQRLLRALAAFLHDLKDFPYVSDEIARVEPQLIEPDPRHLIAWGRIYDESSLWVCSLWGTAAECYVT